MLKTVNEANITVQIKTLISGVRTRSSVTNFV